MTENTNQAPKRPNAQPRKVRMTDDEFERFYNDIYKEFGPADRIRGNDADELLADSPVRSAPVKRQQPAPQQKAAPRQAAAAPVKQEKGIRGLLICACVECLGIAAVVLWWLLKIL